MRVLFDTNVLLDVLLAREPYAGPGARLFALVDNGKLEGAISASTVTTVYYLAAKAVGAQRAGEHLGDLLDLFRVAAVDRHVLTKAITLGFPDYEDAVLHETAVACEAVAIVTRNSRHFRRAALPVFDPEELLAALVAAAADAPE